MIFICLRSKKKKKTNCPIFYVRMIIWLCDATHSTNSVKINANNFAHIWNENKRDKHTVQLIQTLYFLCGYNLCAPFVLY